MNSFNDLTNRLISLKQEELILKIKQEMKSKFNKSGYDVSHLLEYNIQDQPRVKHKLDYYIKANSLDQNGLGKILYESLNLILEQGKQLSKKGTTLWINPKGMNLGYLGQIDYSRSEELIDLLVLPNLLMDLRKKYKLKN